MNAEVVVVGGGPGGAVAARALAQAGRAVVVLEKARFPRHKPCGGCLSPKIVALGVDFASVVEDVIEEAVFTAPGEAPVRYHAAVPLAYMVRRERFDQLLLHQAAETGARVLTEHRVFHAREGKSGVEVVTNRGTFQAPLLIGADGAVGVIARSLSRRPSRTALAMDARLPLDAGLRAAWRGRVLIDFGAVPFGYGWVFPTAGDLSAGVLGPKATVRKLPAMLRQFLGRHELADGSRRVSGWPIPYPAWSPRPVGSHRILLVGDAAGLADPFTGEGIYHAMQSGLLAARAVMAGAAGAADRYRREIRDAFQVESRGAALLAAVIHRAPRWSFRALQGHPGAIDAFVAVLAGRLSYAAFLRKGVRGFFATGWRRLHRGIAS